MPRLTAEQLELRRGGLGSSDIATLCGLNRYATPMRIWLSKRALAEPEPETPEQEWGHLLEDLVAQRWIDVHRDDLLHVRAMDQTIIGDKSWMMCTPDRLVYRQEIPVSLLGPLEVKTAGYRQAHEWGRGEDEVPPVYLVQVQWQLAVMQASCGYLAALIGGNDWREYVLPRDEETIAGLVDIGDRWWRKHIVGDEPPPLDASEDAKRWLASRFPKDTKPLIEAGPVTLELLKRLRQIERLENKICSRSAALKNQLREVIGDTSGIQSDIGVITFRSRKDGIRVFKTKWKNNQGGSDG